MPALCFARVVHSFYLQRCSTQSTPLSSRNKEELSWRARFAVEVHAVLFLPDFQRVSQPLALLEYDISTVRF